MPMKIKITNAILERAFNKRKKPVNHCDNNY